MGRYFTGDIEGKFWFALQSSDAPSRFGGRSYIPEYIEYYFDEENIKEIDAEIQRIELALGSNKKVIEDAFSKNNTYNEHSLLQLGITSDILRDYADLGIGKQIRDCIESSGSCSFQAEL
jgi:hypothetical protein